MARGGGLQNDQGNLQPALPMPAPPTHRCTLCGGTRVSLQFPIWVDMPIEDVDFDTLEVFIDGERGYRVDWTVDPPPEGDPRRGFCKDCNTTSPIERIAQ